MDLRPVRQLVVDEYQGSCLSARCAGVALYAGKGGRRRLNRTITEL
jgi:hypothetical protein